MLRVFIKEISMSLSGKEQYEPEHNLDMQFISGNNTPTHYEYLFQIYDNNGSYVGKNGEFLQFVVPHNDEEHTIFSCNHGNIENFFFLKQDPDLPLYDLEGNINNYINNWIIRISDGHKEITYNDLNSVARI